jgi:hypothetical protein
MQPFKIVCFDSSHSWQPLFTIIFHFYHPHGILLRDATFRMLSASLMPQNAKNMKPVLSVALDLSNLSGDKDWLHLMDAADWVL